jgi:hypothetical protein
VKNFGTWATIWVICIGAASPVYLLLVSRNQTSRIIPFLLVELLAVGLSVLLWHMDPRGIGGPGYLLLLVVAPFTVGWTSCGILEAVGWVAARLRQADGG